MSHWTCYSEPISTCFMVSATPSAVIEPANVFFGPTSGVGDEGKPKTTKTTRTEDDGKPVQTNDDAKPEGTMPPDTTSVRHITVPATNTLSEPSAEPTHTVKTNAPNVAISTVDGNSGSSTEGAVSPGAVAGIAIATAIIGAAIAFLVAFVLFKRRRPSRHGHSESSTNFITKGEQPSYIQVSQLGPPPVLAALSSPPNRTVDLSDLSHSSDFLAGVLPSAADEQEVNIRVTTVFGQILRHVSEFYRDVHATLTPSMENDLKKFGDSYVDLAKELERSTTPTIAIKHALVGYILSIVAPEAEQQPTLFPTEVAGLRQHERSFESPDDQAAYIIYKRLAAHLHVPPASSLQSRQSDMREAAEHFALTFFPWANPAYADQDKDEDLVVVVNNALNMSLWLFGQPYLYEWVWEGVGRRGTVISPGLVRVTDERGKMLDRPRKVVDAVIATD